MLTTTANDRQPMTCLVTFSGKHGSISLRFRVIDDVRFSDSKMFRPDSHMATLTGGFNFQHGVFC